MDFSVFSLSQQRRKWRFRVAKNFSAYFAEKGVRGEKIYHIKDMQIILPGGYLYMVDIGIDKIQLSNFAVKYIDMDRIKDMAQQTDAIKIIAPNAKHGLRVEIFGGRHFGKLVVGYDYYKKHGEYYTELTLSPSNVCGHNLYNLSYTYYNELLPLILDHIESKYGIDLDCCSAKVKTIEINSNIRLLHRYDDYARVTRLLMSLLPIRNAEVQTCDGGETLLRKNGSVALAIYNKTDQVRKKIPKLVDDEDPDIMRIELRLLNASKVESAFGSNDWHTLNDDTIRAYMCKYMNNNMANEYKKWHERQEALLVEMIAAKRAQHKTRWQENLLIQILNDESINQGVPIILDVGQICAAMGRVPDRNGNLARARKSMSKPRADNDVLHNNDRAKVAEILGVFTSHQIKQ